MSRTRTATTLGVATLLVLTLCAAITAPAVSASERHHRKGPGLAWFEGRQIDLRRGWGDAHACVVWQQDGETECFRSERAADAAVARRDRQATQSSSASSDTQDMQALSTSTCGTWLRLYEHAGYGGRSLQFRDRGYTQDLAAWGFANETSSYRIGGCSASFRDGSGSLYPGNLGAWVSASSMLSGWNDRVRYLRIN